MQLEFPYQIVTFLGKEPELHESVYQGVNGWYPQIALKRRFKVNTINEGTLIELLKNLFDQAKDIAVMTGVLTKPARMPVQVIDIRNQEALSVIHINLLKSLGDKITSRYPDREGNDYYAHITAEYDGKFVIAVDEYINKEIILNNIWLLKDEKNEDSLAYFKFK